MLPTPTDIVGVGSQIDVQRTAPLQIVICDKSDLIFERCCRMSVETTMEGTSQNNILTHNKDDR